MENSRVQAAAMNDCGVIVLRRFEKRVLRLLSLSEAHRETSSSHRSPGPHSTGERNDLHWRYALLGAWDAAAECFGLRVALRAVSAARRAALRCGSLGKKGSQL